MRSLTTVGNEKLGASIHHFDIPAIASCPGSTALCRCRCYARKGRFNFPQVQDRLRWCFEQSQMPDFVDRMVEEIRQYGVLAMRFHVSGDVYSPGYCRKLYQIVSRCPLTRFWMYSRSWRVPQIAKELRRLAKLPNMGLWFSADKLSGLPRRSPRVRIAWMQVEEEDAIPKGVDLVFLDHPLRKVQLPILADICPQEQPGGKHVTCAHCQICFPE